MAKINQGPTVLIPLIVILTPRLIIAKRKDRPLTSKGALNGIAIVLHLSRKEVRLNLSLSLSRSLSVSFFLNAAVPPPPSNPLPTFHFSLPSPSSPLEVDADSVKEKNRFDPMQLA